MFTFFLLLVVIVLQVVTLTQVVRDNGGIVVPFPTKAAQEA